MPKLSIITVCRNEAERIRLTAESILQQTHRDVEWIVKDGGSTDGTLDALETYKLHVACFMEGPDAGVYDAMNQAAARATGDWLLFLNGGDALARPEALEAMLPYLLPGRSLVVGACRCVWPDDREPLVKAREGILDRSHFYRHTINHQSTFIARSLFGKMGPYDTSFRFCADHDFFARCTLAGEGVHCVPELVAEYDMSGMSAQAKGSPEMNAEFKKIRSRYPLGFRARRAAEDWMRRRSG